MKPEDLYAGFVHLHILYHTSKGPIFGLWIVEELARHGYQMSPGTLYPALHRLEHAGYLTSQRQLVQGHFRRVYSITPTGLEILVQAKDKVRELFGELFERSHA
ncbi:MAG: helix-turn-helix transcriptional regulator [Chloroflexi bacterium]|nr:helix-turn-helix transcriptional regulator [Chloroflexota bacterium]